MSPSPTTRRPLAALALLGVASLASSCQGPHEIRYETEHLRIGTDFDDPLCRGDLDHLERVFTSAETVLATEVSQPIEVYLWPLSDWNPEGLCSVAGVQGCYSKATIYATLHSVEHEIVHGVIDSMGDPAPFWEEGAAEALSDRSRFGPSAPVLNLELGPPELDYGASTAFARWLLETRGPELFRALLRHRGGAREAFESVYGLSAEDAQDEYFETSPYSYGVMVACEHAELAQLGPHEWAESIDMDCDSAHVFGGPDGVLSARRTLKIVDRGFYTFSTSAGALTIARCQDVDLESAPILDDPAMGDVPFMTPTFPEFSQWFEGDEGPVAFDLAPGRYEVSLSQAGYEANRYEVSVIAAQGPIPQDPESSP